MIKHLQDLRFTYNTSTVMLNTPNKKINLQELVNLITDLDDVHPDYFKIGSEFKYYINLNTPVSDIKKIITPYKQKLRWFQLSGYQSRGHTNIGIEYNGCVQIDIDFKEVGGDVKALEVKNLLSTLPYVVFAGISPSGVGVKGLVATDNYNKDIHINVLNEVLEAIDKNTTIDILKYKDPIACSTPCFEFKDANLYYNENAIQFVSNPTFKAKRKTIKITKSPTQTSNKTNQFVEVQYTKREREKRLDDAFTRASRKHKGDKATPFYTCIAGIVINYGIGPTHLLKYLKELDSSITPGQEASILDMYTRYGYQSLDYLDGIEANEAWDNDENKTKHYLSANQYLSDINISLTENAIVEAGTGVGKSRWWCMSLTQKRVLVVPTIALALQIAKSYNAKPFCTNNWKVENGDNLIVVTYSSLPKLSNLIDVEDYIVGVDESHNTTSSTNTSYLLKVLNDVVDLLPSFKNYFLLTATPLFNYHPHIKDLRTIKVIRENTIKKHLYSVKYKDLFTTIKDLAVNSKKSNQDFLVFYNDTNIKKMGKLIATLDPLNVGVINAKTKDTQAFNDIAIDGDMSKYDGVVATTVIKEGISITKHTDTVNIIVIGKHHAFEIEQLSARFRKAIRVNVFLLYSTKHIDRPSTFDKALEILELEEKAKNTLDFSLGRITDNKVLRLENKLGIEVLRLKDGVVVLDYLRMSFEIFDKEKYQQSIDIDRMKRDLGVFGFEFKRFASNKNEMTKEEKATVVEKNRPNIEQYTMELEECYDLVLLDDVFDNSRKLNDNTLPTIERDIRFRVAGLVRYTDNKTVKEAIDIIKSIGLNKKKWSTLKFQIDIQTFKTDDEFMRNTKQPMSNLIREFYSTLTHGTVGTSDEFRVIINQITSKHLPHANHSKTRTTQILNAFCETKLRKVTIDGTRVNMIEIVNHNPTRLNINTTAYNATSDGATFGTNGDGLFQELLLGMTSKITKK